VRRWASTVGRKFLGLLITDLLLLIGAVAVRNGNFPGLATALIAALASFSAANTVAGIRGPTAPQPLGGQSPLTKEMTHA
jgi:hypothetical protein